MALSSSNVTLEAIPGFLYRLDADFAGSVRFRGIQSKRGSDFEAVALVLVLVF
jgi:hypothetical protein